MRSCSRTIPETHITEHPMQARRIKVRKFDAPSEPLSTPAVTAMILHNRINNPSMDTPSVVASADETFEFIATSSSALVSLESIFSSLEGLSITSVFRLNIGGPDISATFPSLLNCFSRFCHMLVALLQSQARPKNTQQSMNNFVGLNCLIMPISLAA